MANKNQRRLKATLRKGKQHFHGQTCDSAKLRKEAGRSPRDENRKLRALSDKRQLDKRITPPLALEVYAS